MLDFSGNVCLQPAFISRLTCCVLQTMDFFLTSTCTACKGSQIYVGSLLLDAPWVGLKLYIMSWGHKNSHSQGVRKEFGVNAAFSVLLTSSGSCFHLFGCGVVFLIYFVLFCLPLKILHFLHRPPMPLKVCFKLFYPELSNEFSMRGSKNT